MGRHRLVAVALAGALALVGSPVATASPPEADTAVVRVMNLNIFYGGDELDLQTGNFCHRSAGCPETAIEGSATIDAATAVGSATWPFKPGTYEIRFLVDDSYRSIAVSANFKVVKP